MLSILVAVAFQNKNQIKYQSEDQIKDQIKSQNKGCVSFFLILLRPLFLLLMFFLLIPRIMQDVNYHNFADHKHIANIPNFHNVISNIGFSIFGLLGIIFSYRVNLKIWWKIFFWGVFFTAIGSSYYHLNPNNDTLLWDRLPMSVSFMGILSAIYYERVNPKASSLLGIFLIAFGIFSVFYWHVTERFGIGDLRLYVLTQFLSLYLALRLLLKNKRKNSYLLYISLFLYILSKVFEHCDYYFCNLIAISGHALKHYSSSIVTLFVLFYVMTIQSDLKLHQEL